MEYKTDKPIYLQIADYICNQIIQNKWKEDERIPSVRELGVLLSVNPNTVWRSFETVEQQGIIYNKRGIGYFVSPDAKPKILEIYKNDFFEKILPDVFQKMELYGISIDEVMKKFTNR
jgi:DNA-binding transcriptional regulator YhcF (GntR family)